MATWTALTRNTTLWDSNLDFLLQESLSYLLLETGDRIILDPSEGFRDPTIFTNITRN